MERCKAGRISDPPARCVLYDGHAGPHIVPNAKLQATYPDLWKILVESDPPRPMSMNPILADLLKDGYLDSHERLTDAEPTAEEPEPPAEEPEPPAEPEKKTKKRKKKTTTKKRPKKGGIK